MSSLHYLHGSFLYPPKDQETETKTKTLANTRNTPAESSETNNIQIVFGSLSH